MARSIGFMVMLSLVIAACNTGDPVPGPVGAGGLLRPLGEGDGVQGDKVMVCHCPPGKPAGPGKAGCVTLSVAPSALQAHIDHGDSTGPCASGSGGAGGDGTGAASSGMGGTGAASSGTGGDGDGGDGVGSHGGSDHHSPGSCLIEACPTGKTCCVINFKGKYVINKCVDTKTAHGHCGACGNKCDASLTCVGGSCVPAAQKAPAPPLKPCFAGCPSGWTCCQGTCKPTFIDEQNCGACGNACAPGDECCSGACVNPVTGYQSDDQNCGSCGNACTTVGDSCQGGFCCASTAPNLDCPRGRIRAGGSCCTVPCVTHSDCVTQGFTGTCTKGGDFSEMGLSCCGGRCHDVCSDLSNCGGCDKPVECPTVKDGGCCNGDAEPKDQFVANCPNNEQCHPQGEACEIDKNCNSGNCQPDKTCGP